MNLRNLDIPCLKSIIILPGLSGRNFIYKNLLTWGNKPVILSYRHLPPFHVSVMTIRDHRFWSCYTASCLLRIAHWASKAGAASISLVTPGPRNTTQSVLTILSCFRNMDRNVVFRANMTVPEHTKLWKRLQFILRHWEWEIFALRTQLTQQYQRCTD